MLKTYKSFVLELQEALKPSQYRSMVKGWDKSRLEKAFRQSPLEKDRKAYRLYFPLNDDINRRTRAVPNPQVVDALKKQGYDVEDYSAGIAKKGNRKIRIGRLLSREPDVLQMFVNDPARAASKSQYMGVISRHPYDIAGMSTDRGWTSCQDLEVAGRLCRYVPEDVKAGTLIAYMIRSDDKDIKKPLGRVLIKPYVNIKKETAYGIAKVTYGTVTKEFERETKKFVDFLNRHQDVKGIFHIDSNVYKGVDVDDVIHVTDDKKEEMIFKVPEYILTLDKPTVDMMMVAVDREPSLLPKIERKFGEHEDVRIAFVTSSPLSIKKIRNPSEKVQLAAVSVDANAIKFIPNPTEKVQLVSVEKTPFSLKYIKNPTEKVQLAAVKQDGFVIGEISNPSEKVQIEAVRKNSSAIQKIEDPTEKVQLAVMRMYPEFIGMIKNPTENAQLIAVKNSAHNIHRITDPTEKVQLVAVNADVTTVANIKNPTEKVQLLAIEKNPAVYNYINNKTTKATQLYQSITGKRNNKSMPYKGISQTKKSRN